MNEKQRQNLESFEEIMMAYNPFGFKKEDGKVCMFNSYADVYEYTMKKLYEKFPKGYVDLSLFIHEMCGMPLDEAESIVKGFRIQGVSDVMFQPELWRVDGMMMSHTLVKIMQALHCITETEFDSMMFQAALDNFINKVLKKTKKENEEKTE